MSLKHISDTAHWMAYMRFLESERRDALLSDPYARQLAGDLGEAIARQIGSIGMIGNSIAVRTATLDRLILDTVTQHGVDLVLNIGSGLDTRPWRLALPEQLQWIDIDLPALVSHKTAVLSTHRPRCRYEIFAADILDSAQRAAVIAAYPQALRMLVVTEGLLVYLQPSQVEVLAKELHRHPGCQWWLTDLVGPRALQILRQVWAPRLRATQFQFGPPNSVEFFARLGWQEYSFYSAQEEARRLHRATRVPWLTRLFIQLAAPSVREEMRRAAGVAVLARQEEKTG